MLTFLFSQLTFLPRAKYNSLGFSVQQAARELPTLAMGTRMFFLLGVLNEEGEEIKKKCSRTLYLQSPILQAV
jgi:hypothetical protein